MMNDEQLAAVSDKSYFDSWRGWCAFVDGGETVEDEGVLIARTSAPVPWLNIAFVTRKLAAPDAAIADAVRYFDERDQPFIIRIREGIDPDAEGAAEAQGFAYADTIPGMTLHPLPEAPQPPEGLTISTVADEQGLEGLIDVSAEAFGMPVEGMAQLLTMRFIEDPGWQSYLGSIDGQPVAAAMLQLDGTIAGVYFVGTRAAYRRRGLGEAMTWHAVREGAKAGCTVAALQASEMGRPVYERMGFRTVAGYRTFLRK